MIKKLVVSVFFLLCLTQINFVYADSIFLGPIYSDTANELSLAITLPPGQKVVPTQDDFQLFDGDNPVARANSISKFSTSENSLSLIMCVDASGSINNTILNDIKESLTKLVRSPVIKQGYKFALTSIGDQVKQELNFTDDLNVIEKAIYSLQISKGKKTLLYQGLLECLDKLNKQPNTDYKILLTISDGKNEDRGEDIKNKTYEAIVQKSKSLSIPINAIARGKIPRQFADGMRGLAEATNGQFVFPDLELKQIEEKKRLGKTTITVLQNIIDNIWIVNFNFQNKPVGLTNPGVTFKENGIVRLTSYIPKLPEPIADVVTPKPAIKNSPTSPGESLDNESLKKKLFYFAIGSLLLATLAFLAFFIIKRINDKSSKQTSSGEIKIEPVIEGTVTHDVRAKPVADNRRRTEVGYVVKNNDQGLEASLALLVSDNLLQNKKVSINKQQFQIGANANNDLIINDDYVSGNHALIQFINGIWELSDLNSRNGTFINGTQLRGQPIELSAGDEIKIGNSTIRVIEN
jgi:Mg-chelatase subunit ChlD